MKEFFLRMRAKLFDVEAKKLVCILHEADIKELGIFANDRVLLSNKKNGLKIHAVVDTTDSVVKTGEIGVFLDVAKALMATENSFLQVSAAQQPKSISFIRRKLDKKRLSAGQIREIVADILSNRLSDVEVTAFVAGVYINGFDLSETVAMTRALVENGKKIVFDKGTVVDKHSVGGTNGRTTMVIVPIISACGLLIPKTSSRTITSAAGTADAMEVLARVDLPIEKIREITQKTGGVIAWGGAVDLAPVDDKIIKIEHPLSIDPQGQVIASVMAKKASVGAKFLVIDLPVGPEVKIKSKKEARAMAMKFLEVGKKLGIKVEVVITNAESPSGQAFGPALEAKYVLEVLEGRIFDGFAQKSIGLAGALLELAGAQKHGEGVKKAKQVLQSGLALKKMQEIIKAQGGKTFSSKDVKMAPLKKTFFAPENFRVKKIHIHQCTVIARASGAPSDKKAGLLLKVVKGQKVKKGAPLFEIFAQNPQKMQLAIGIAQKHSPVEMEKIVLKTIS